MHNADDRRPGMRNLTWVLTCVLVFSAGTLFAQGRPVFERRPGTVPPVETNGALVAKLQADVANLTKMVEQLQRVSYAKTLRLHDLQKRLDATCFLWMRAHPGPNKTAYTDQSCTSTPWPPAAKAFFEVPFGR